MDFIVILASCIMDFDIFWWTSVVTTPNIQCPSRGTEGSNTELWQARLDWPHLTWVASFGCVKTGTSHGERAQIMTKSWCFFFQHNYFHAQTSHSPWRCLIIINNPHHGLLWFDVSKCMWMSTTGRKNHFRSFFWSPKCYLDSRFQHGSLPLLSSSSSLMHLQYIWMKRWGEVSQDLKDFQTLLATRVGKDLLPDLPRKRYVKSCHAPPTYHQMQEREKPLSPLVVSSSQTVSTRNKYDPVSADVVWSKVVIAEPR